MGGGRFLTVEEEIEAKQKRDVGVGHGAVANGPESG